MRVVGDNVGQPQVLPIRDALKLADELELDLIEISPKAEPPVCRIDDYQKFLYQQKKKAKELKANQTKVVVKEIRFGPQTDDHDYNFKLKHAQNFLKEVPRSRPTSSSADVRSSSRSRAKSCCCALPPISKSSPKWRRCPGSTARR